MHYQSVGLDIFQFWLFSNRCLALTHGLSFALNCTLSVLLTSWHSDEPLWATRSLISHLPCLRLLHWSMNVLLATVKAQVDSVFQAQTQRILLPALCGCSCSTERQLVNSGQCLLGSCFTHYVATRTRPLTVVFYSVLCCIFKNMPRRRHEAKFGGKITL